MPKTDTKTFVAVVGLNYPTSKGEARIEAGKPVTDLPAKSIAWLKQQGLIVARDTTNSDVEDED